MWHRQACKLFVLLRLAGDRAMAASLEDPSTSGLGKTEPFSLRKAKDQPRRSHQKLVEWLEEVCPPVCSVQSNCAEVP